jgi:hypothetical protein
VKATFTIDPKLVEYGAATPAVRQILTEWMSVDWFEPHAGGAAAARATRLFQEHHEKGRAQAPELFPTGMEILVDTGGWADFAALCGRVREGTGTSWDWRYSVLKRLSSEHSKRHGLRLSELARAGVETGLSPGPGDLFFSTGGDVIWNGLWPSLELGRVLSPENEALAHWYLGYAQMDVLEAIEWQLAEKSDCVDGNPSAGARASGPPAVPYAPNPFVPLVHCYGAGFYPFSLGPRLMTLFAFQR